MPGRRRFPLETHSQSQCRRRQAPASASDLCGESGQAARSVSQRWAQTALRVRAPLRTGARFDSVEWPHARHLLAPQSKTSSYNVQLVGRAAVVSARLVFLTRCAEAAGAGERANGPRLYTYVTHKQCGRTILKFVADKAGSGHFGENLHPGSRLITNHASAHVSRIDVSLLTTCCITLRSVSHSFSRSS